jgi:hypothetical protein
LSPRFRPRQCGEPEAHRISQRSRIATFVQDETTIEDTDVQSNAGHAGDIVACRRSDRRKGGDAMTTPTFDGQMHAALDVNIPNYAAVVTTNDLIALLSSAASPRAARASARA